MLKKILQHKVISGIIIAALIGGGIFAYSIISGTKKETRYILGTVEKGTIISSVSGTGQVSASDQVDLKAKASGDIIYLGIKNGQEVKKGQLLLQLDTTDAKKAVSDAEVALAKEQLSLDKLKGMTTDLGTLRGSKEKAQDALDKAYEDGFNSVSNVFLGLPTVIAGLQNILLSYGFSPNQWNIDYYMDATKIYDARVMQYREDAYNKYQTARAAYDKNFQEYKATSRSSDEQTIETLISDTYETVKSIADAVKSSNNLIQFYQDTLTTRGYTAQTLSNTHLSSLNTYTGNTNSYLSSLLSAKTTIQTDKEAIMQTEFDLSDQEIKVKEAENSLQDIKDALRNYYVYASFDGVISTVNVKKGDSISASTTIATLVTKQQIAELSLNEIDAAKVKTGQKANLTFDAVENLNITGEVADINTVGTVSQGVVSYSVKISFDTQDDRVKPGMSVSASIITDAKQDVLLVPSSAVKTTGNNSYVQIVDVKSIEGKNINSNTGVVLENPAQQQTVTTGLSDDTSTEILTGIKEGDTIIVRTVTAVSTTTSQTGTNRTGGGVGGVRIPGF